MGQEYSTDDGEPGPSHFPEKIDPSESDIDFESLSGYRVMKVFSGSPASRSGLAPFEDFIVAVNGSVVQSDTSTLSNILREHEGKELALVVWNCVDSKERNVGLTPVQWNGPGLLGAAVRYEAIRGCAEHVQRVMDVLPNSPADEAGLAPKTDYIVGTRAEVFRGENDFNKLISDALKRRSAESFMVYSTATGRTRTVEIRPNSNWGGEGSIGCELATGLLHRIKRSS